MASAFANEQVGKSVTLGPAIQEFSWKYPIRSERMLSISVNGSAQLFGSILKYTAIL